MGKFCNVIYDLKPAIMTVVVQIAFAGVNVLYKLAAYDGMSLRVLVAYRFIFATAFILPLALIFERNRPKMTWTILFQAFLCGLFGGSLMQNLYVESVALTSASFTSAMTNLVPAMTFILAVCFGLEKLGLRTMTGKAKVVGTLIGIGGAILLTFYKGFEIKIWSTNINLLHGGHLESSHKSSANQNLGYLCALGSVLSFASWLIIQAKMSKRYPCRYSSTALMAMMGSIQSIVFALCTEKDWSQWKLGWNIRLLSVAYRGIVGSGVMVILIAWVIQMRGPLFASVFNPLMYVIVGIVGSLVLDEKLHLGRYRLRNIWLLIKMFCLFLIGAMLIVFGLYMVLWSQGKEMKKITQLVPSESPIESEFLEIIITSPRLKSSMNEDWATKQEENEKKNHKSGLMNAIQFTVLSLRGKNKN